MPASKLIATRAMFRRFIRNKAGNITAMFGLSAIPLVAAAGMAIDYARISRVHDKVQLIADGATLSAASVKYLTGTSTQKAATRVTIATNYLNRGLSTLGDAEVIGSPAVTANGSAVSVSVVARVKGSLINVLDAIQTGSALINGGDGGNGVSSPTARIYDVKVNSKASWNAGVNYVCLLALNPSNSQSLMLKGTADIKAKGCSVQVNSTSNTALYENGTTTVTASKISVKGGYVGSGYTPIPYVNVDPFPDPLLAKTFTNADSYYAHALAAAKPIYSSNAQDSWPAGTNVVEPGIYKGGWQVGQNVTLNLKPGIYFIKDGALEIKPGGVVNGTGVTFVLYGSSKAYIDVQAGGNLNIKAPATGDFAGIAIAQHPSTIPTVAKNNSIIGGGTVEMCGIIYFPKQTLMITGNGSISMNSDLFSVVADTIYVEGNGQLTIGQSADFDAAGLPALPSSGSGQAKVSLQ
jgi:hypothetical protein